LKDQSGFVLSLAMFLGGALGLGVRPAFADIQNNALDIHQKNANCMELSLNFIPPILLQRMTPSKLAYGPWIDQLLRMPDKDFDQKVNKAQKFIEKNTHLISNMWGPLKVKWTWGETNEWKKSANEQALILTLPITMQGHPRSVRVMAEACSHKPIGRVQIDFSPALYPLYVDVDKKDQFWLTEEIPQTTVDFIN